MAVATGTLILLLCLTWRVSAIKNWEVVLKLNPVNAADIYYTLFELRQSESPEAAYDDLLSVLELAPRHQPGLQAFLKWHNQDQNDGGAP